MRETGEVAARHVVDHALQRRAVLAELRSGRRGTADVCDAGPYLLRAAGFHGRPSTVACPVCPAGPLTLVSWVYGEGLGPVAGSARTPEELARLAGTAEEFSVHDVEVCRGCGWNHLVRSYVLGLPVEPGRRRPRRRTAGG